MTSSEKAEMQTRRWISILRAIALAERVAKAKVGERVIEQEESVRPVDAGGCRQTPPEEAVEAGQMYLRRSPRRELRVMG
jgi:hypothetical protein